MCNTGGGHQNIPTMWCASAPVDLVDTIKAAVGSQPVPQVQRSSTERMTEGHQDVQDQCVHQQQQHQQQLVGATYDAMDDLLQQGLQTQAMPPRLEGSVSDSHTEQLSEQHQQQLLSQLWCELQQPHQQQRHSTLENDLEASCDTGGAARTSSGSGSLASHAEVSSSCGCSDNMAATAGAAAAAAASLASAAAATSRSFMADVDSPRSCCSSLDGEVRAGSTCSSTSSSKSKKRVSWGVNEYRHLPPKEPEGFGVAAAMQAWSYVSSQVHVSRTTVAVAGAAAAAAASAALVVCIARRSGRS